jgi:hypothetical protein
VGLRVVTFAMQNPRQVADEGRPAPHAVHNPPGVASEAPYCLSEIDFHSASQNSPADTRIAVKA